MGGHPLRSPTRRCLGRPLPYQLADGPQAPPKAAILRSPLVSSRLEPSTVCGISSPFELLFPTSGQVTYVLRTHSPLRTRLATGPAFDLHVLSTPPAFILSQDQTLRMNCKMSSDIRRSFKRNRRFHRPRRSANRHIGWPSKLLLPLVLLPITFQLLRCSAPPAPERTDSTTPPSPLSRQTKIDS